MKKKNRKQTSAATIAYKALLRETKIKPAMLVKKYPGITFPTLLRIKHGKKGLQNTDEHYLKLFLRLLKMEYNRRIKEEGGEGASTILKIFMEISCLEHDI